MTLMDSENASVGVRPLSAQSLVFLPAPGEGIVALAIRDHDDATRMALSVLGDEATDVALRAERVVVEKDVVGAIRDGLRDQ
jgi:porphobilinogen deaminase